MQESALGNQVPFEARIGDLPGDAAIQAACQEVQLRRFAVDVMSVRSKVLVKPFGEAHQDFIPPDPDPVVRRPSAKTSLLIVNRMMLDILNRNKLSLCNQAH